MPYPANPCARTAEVVRVFNLIAKAFWPGQMRVVVAGEGPRSEWRIARCRGQRCGSRYRRRASSCHHSPWPRGSETPLVGEQAEFDRWVVAVNGALSNRGTPSSSALHRLSGS